MSPEKKELKPSSNKGVDRSSSIVGASHEDASDRLYSDTLPTSVRIQTDKQRGSGFFVDGDGLVATASHVVIHAKELFAYTADGKKYRAVLEKLGDTEDVAILKLQNFEGLHSKFLPRRNISTLRSGEPLYVMGHPHGIQNAKMFPVSVTSTITSYDLVNKDVVAQSFKVADERDKKDLLAALSRPVLAGETRVESGTSGAVLFDKLGQAVGLTAISDKEKNQSYFVKSENIDRLIEEASKFQFLYSRESTPPSERFLAKPCGGSAAKNLSSYGSCKLNEDYTEYKKSTDTRDTVKYGLATVFDAVVATGSHPLYAPLVGPVALAAGLIGRYAVDLIPNRLVLSDIKRKDGDPRPPFDWHSVKLK